MKQKKTTKVTLSGGFHNVGAISVRIPAEKMKTVDEQLHGVLDLLTSYQWKRVQKHFCGIKDCHCGGAYRNAVIEIAD